MLLPKQTVKKLAQEIDVNPTGFKKDVCSRIDEALFVLEKTKTRGIAWRYRKLGALLANKQNKSNV